MAHRVFLCLPVLAALLLAATSAAAYCRATTCDDVASKSCNVESSACRPQKWQSGCLGYTVDFDGARAQGIDYETASELVRQAFVTWLAADCGGGQRPALHVYDLGPSYCGEHEYHSASRNANSWSFREADWPHASSDDAYAITFTRFDETGALRDADVEINATEHWFAFGNGKGVDLQAVITHEAGHVLGLNHSDDESSIMFPSYSGRHELGADDVAAICSHYPPGPPPTCNAEPRNGMFRQCGESEITGHGCSTSRGRVDPSDALFGLVFCMAGAIAARRRSSR